MGYKAVSAVIHHSEAKGNSRLVALAIAHFHDDRNENGAWPSQDVLAKLANVNKRTVQRAIVELVALGEIDVIVHGGRGATFDRQTNKYFIILDCPESCDGSFNHRNIDDKFDKLTRQLRHTKTTKWADYDDSGVALTVKNNKEHLKAVI
jgi:hypothetical protein